MDSPRGMILSKEQVFCTEGVKLMTREEARKLLKQLDRDDLRKIKAMAEMLNARRKAAEKNDRKAV